MFQQYQPLCALLVAAGAVRGRKKLQKMVYIAQTLGYPFGEPFQLHMYGPYSDTLTTRLREMQDWGFGHETEEPGPGGGPVYTYRPGARAAALVQEIPPGLRDLAVHLNEQDPTLLEGVATLLYLQGQGYSAQEAAALLPRLKPNKFANPARVAEAAAFARGLDRFRAAAGQ
jgi:uncharacterized protein YwgA